jgi:hypothetical protein
LQGALNETATIRIGTRQKTLSKGAAGIEHLVDQFAKDDRNARRDLIPLCDRLGVDLTDRDAFKARSTPLCRLKMKRCSPTS